MDKTGGGMGSKKHGKSGTPTKSPRYRYQSMLEGQKDERKAKPPLPHASVADAFKASK